jgi:hypothetical protein
VRFPPAWGEEMDGKGGRGIEALPHGKQIDLGIAAWAATGGEYTLAEADRARAHFGPTEQPVPSPHRKSPHFPFPRMGIKGDLGSGQNHCEGRFPLQRRPGRLGKGRGGEQDRCEHRRFEPGKEGRAERVGVLAPRRPLGCGCPPVRAERRFLARAGGNTV